MLSLFKRKKKSQTVNPLQEKVVNGIVEKVIAFQLKWASFMQRQSERFSVKGKKMITILTVLCASFYSLYIIASSIVQKQKGNYSYSKIRVPVYATKTGDEKMFSKNIIPEKEYNRIIRFQQYMDSLHKTASGKLIADSILQRRPGLMDSVIELKKLYESQQKQKN